MGGRSPRALPASVPHACVGSNRSSGACSDHKTGLEGEVGMMIQLGVEHTICDVSLTREDEC